MKFICSDGKCEYPSGCFVLSKVIEELAKEDKEGEDDSELDLATYGKVSLADFDTCVLWMQFHHEQKDGGVLRYAEDTSSKNLRMMLPNNAWDVSFALGVSTKRMLQIMNIAHFLDIPGLETLMQAAIAVSINGRLPAQVLEDFGGKIRDTKNVKAELSAAVHN